MAIVPPVRIVLVDGYALVREGTRRILAGEPDLEVVGEADSVERALELLAAVQADVVLVEPAAQDLFRGRGEPGRRVPDVAGVQAIRQIRALHPGLRVMVLSERAELAAEALRAGASGYFLKTAHGAELIAAVRSVFLGTTVIQGQVAESLGWGGDEGRRDERASSLSNREVEVIQLVARGLSNRAIARTLGIGPRTADQHVHSIFIKLGVRSRTEAVAYALHRDLTS